MFKPEKMKYASSMKEVTLGAGDKAVTLGGKTTYPFQFYEGESKNKPKIAMEMWDINPSDAWPEAAVAPFKDVVDNPVAWAEKCLADGADVLVLSLRSTDPNGEDRSPEDAAAMVKEIAEKIGDTPLVVWGTSAAEKDEEVLKAVAEACQDKTLILGPVEEANHKGIGAAALAYKHMVVSSSPIDVNIAKQTNILLENLGLPLDRVLVDPTTGGIGYGMEYSYSVMERVLQAAMMQGDEKLQSPMVNFLSFETWKSKEAGQSVEDAPTLGDPERRGIMMETTCAINLLMAGSDLLVMRHPEAVRLVRSYIDIMCDGGEAKGIAGIAKSLDPVTIDYTKFAPAPDLKIEEPKKKAPKKEAAAPAIAKKGAEAPKAEAKKEEAPKAAPVTEARTCGSSAQRDAEAAVIAEERAKDDAEARIRMEAELRAKIAAEADQTAAKEKADAEKKEAAKKQAAADALKAKAAAKQAVIDAWQAHEDAEAELKAKRAAAQDHESEPVMKLSEVAQSAAGEHKGALAKMVQRLDQIHKRNC